MSLPWVERFRPKTKSDLVGNSAAINGLHLFLKRWSEDTNPKAALLLGPAGCGKTSAVYALAKDLNYSVMEVNASDTRKKSSIQDILQPATRFSSLDDTYDKKIILMDEVDGLSGRHDRGGLSEFIKIIKKTKYPIIGTANDPESSNIEKLQKRKEMRTYTFERLDEFHIFELLLKISDDGNLGIPESILEQIAENVSGDIRAAINELESHVSGTSKLQLEDRNKMRTLLALLNDLFRAKDFETARKVLLNAPSDYYKLLLHIYDETYKQCKTPEEVAVAYEQIAQADMYYTRIMRTQNWSLLKYFFDFIGPGINLARKSNHFKKIPNLPNIPSAFMARGRAKSIQSKARKVAPQVAPKLHISQNDFIHNQYRYFEQIILGKNGSEIAAWLDLDDDQIDALTKKKESSDLASNIDEARAKVSKFRAEKAKQQPPTLSGLDMYFAKPTKDDEEEEIDEEDPFVPNDEEKDKESQLSLDDFF